MAKAVASLETTTDRSPSVITRRLQRATKTGAWLTVQPSTVNGTKLGAQEWRDAAFLRYGLKPPDLSKHCNGCNTKFSIFYALDCKRGVLVTAQPWDMRELLPARQIRDPVTELIMTRRDEATPLAVKGVANVNVGVAAVAVFGEVWGL